VLDVGCWDGFNTFEAIRRGAERVVAADHFVWHHGSRAAFELAGSVIAPNRYRYL